MNKLGPIKKLHQNQTKFVDNGNKFSVIVRYSLKFPSLVQYFFVLGNSIFLHFWSVSNKLIKAHVSFRFLLLPLKSHCCATFLAISRQIRIHKTFWKVPRQTNSYVSNKWPLKLPCAYLNTQESSRTETFFKRIQDG
ncbi:hypothetical protein T07_2671 [Trichinella nelsoni]|uniref:Uncharacterized protein n=1 Tax=Trichinella nelsoni TaxID=6336 RepID=A0A0V0SN34_9BILA|nr:hypothetical protein T07_2671 [Trichinella nelsoni]